MVSDLNLSGNRLIIYAIIHGFSRDFVHEFNGSINYLCKWTNLSKNTVLATLKSLIDDGLIAKREYEINNVKFCSYKICTSGAEIAPPSQKLNGGSAEIALGGSAEIAPHNIDNTSTENKDTSVSNEVESTLFTQSDSFNWDGLMQYFNSTMANKAIKPISRFTPKRKQAVRARLREYGRTALGEAIRNAAASDFLNGKNSHGFTATFDWIFLPNNFPKVLEGNYDNRDINNNNNSRYEQRANDIQQRAEGAARVLARLAEEEGRDS